MTDPMKTDQFPLLTSAEAAEYLAGISPRTLARWRMLGTGPAYVKLGKRLVRYSTQDLDAFVEANKSR